jgi:hypothetical protein
MQIVKLPVGTPCVDTVTPLTSDILKKLASERPDVKGVFRYLATLTSEEICSIHAAGLVVAFVSYADDFNSQREIQRLATLGIPQGAATFCDVEGEMKRLMPMVNPASIPPEALGPTGENPFQQGISLQLLSTKINARGKDVEAAGFVPGGYFGAGQPFTSEELTNLLVRLYWHAASLVRDRFGKEAGPSVGWAVYQESANTNIGGSLFDIDSVRSDFKGREVSFVGP